MEVKYEAVFGDQALFDGVPEYIEFIRFNDYSREYLWGDSNSINHLTFKDLKAIPIVAMRRIIRTPAWTVAGHKAVGLELAHKTQGSCEFIGRGVDDKTCRALKLKNDLIYIAYKNWCSPIESPEEKAARLRSEWCKKAIGCAPISSEMQHYEMKRLGEYIGNIYDALLSVDLQVPKVE